MYCPQITLKFAFGSLGSYVLSICMMLSWIFCQSWFYFDWRSNRHLHCRCCLFGAFRYRNLIRSMTSFGFFQSFVMFFFAFFLTACGQEEKWLLQGHVEVDATSVRKMHVSLKNPLLELALDLGSVSHDSLLCVGLTSNLHPGRYALSTHLRNFSGPIALWRASHAGQRKKYILFFWRFAGALERGHGGRFLIRELPHVMVGPGGRPPTESKYDVTQSKLLERTQTSTKIYADGNKAWLGHCKVLKRKCYHKWNMWKCNGPKNLPAESWKHMALSASTGCGVLWRNTYPKSCLANMLAVATWTKRFESTSTVSCGDIMLPRKSDWTSSAIWPEILSEYGMKLPKVRFFFGWEKKTPILTNVNAWKSSKLSAKTKEFQTWSKKRHAQSAARVAKTTTEALPKGANSAGPLGAPWPCFYSLVIISHPSSSPQVWCFAGEDLQKRVQQLAQASVKGNNAASAVCKIVRHYRLAMQIATMEHEEDLPAWNVCL